MIDLLRKITPEFVLSWYHLSLAFLSALLYRFPSKDLIVIGVTGTNGKSTTVDMITRVFKEAGFNTASMSSIRFQIGDKEWRNKLKMTMPGRFLMQKFLRQSVKAGCKYAVIEVTSEGMLQHRHRFINFYTAVFTNLSPEHIERHGGFENYKKTKAKLFQATKKVHVINTDNEHADYYSQFHSEMKYFYGIENPNSLPRRQAGKAQISNQAQNLKSKTIKANNVQALENGLSFMLENIEFNLKLLGEFNVSNALAAICVGLSQEVSLETCKKALEKMEGVPGRMERVITGPFQVFVDYAFTPAALEKVYKTLRPQNGNLICVFGATGGGRDSWKRPVLGKIAADHCNKIILTDEDPYEEDPMQIIEEVARGTGDKEEKILDRRKAIARGLSLAQPGDVMVVTGKGSEDSMALKGGKKIPWDDREVVREEFAKANSEK